MNVACLYRDFMHFHIFLLVCMQQLRGWVSRRRRVKEEERVGEQEKEGDPRGRSNTTDNLRHDARNDSEFNSIHGSYIL